MNILLRLVVTLLAGALVMAPRFAGAQDAGVEVGGLVDLRYARTDDERSWLDGGFGKLRYGAGISGPGDLIRLSQASLLLRAEITPVLSVRVQVNADAEPDEAGLRGRLDLVEAFAVYRPELTPRVRLLIRGGAFFPPVSLEHEGPAWTSTYSITGSAANSWIGEEVRTVGLEASLVLKWERDEVRLTGAGFGSNDPAGTLLGWRGWAMHDRQTGFGDRLVLPPNPGLAPGGPFAANAQWVRPMVEIDGRVGWYAGGQVLRQGVFEARALHYDNRGVQTVFDGWQYAWLTRFDSFGLRIELPGRVHLLGQHLRGETHMGKTPAGEDAVHAPFRTSFAMVSVPIRRHRFSLRYDRFRVQDEDVMPDLDPNDEDGDAWTACYAFEATGNVRFALEVIHLESERAVRRTLALPLRQEETLLQASWRLSF